MSATAAAASAAAASEPLAPRPHALATEEVPRALRGQSVLGYLATAASLILFVVTWKLQLVVDAGASRRFVVLVKFAICMQVVRLGHGAVLLALQLIAVQQTRHLAKLNREERGSLPFTMGAEELAAARPGNLSVYLWLVFVLAAGYVVLPAEAAAAGLLTGFAPTVTDFRTNARALGTYVGAIVCMWIAIALRVVSSALCLRWQRVFHRDRFMWFTHYRLRVSASLRWFFCLCCCRWDYMWGQRSREPVLAGVFDQDELTGTATMMAYVLNYRSLGLRRFEMMGLLSKLLYDEAKRLRKEKEDFERRVSQETHREREAAKRRSGVWLFERSKIIKALLQREDRVPPQPDLGPLRESLEKALDLNKFALGVYTGMLLDAERSWCCYILQWFFTQGYFWSWLIRRHRDQGRVQGDNCAQGHRTKFLDYIAESDVTLHAGRVGQGACRVSYQLISRGGGTGGGSTPEIVLAIRGTEDIHDMVTDSLMWPCELTKDELGLPAGAHVHLGVLLCVRNLLSEIATTLDQIAADAPSSTPVWVVGHSLGASVAALFVVAVRHDPAYPHLASARAISYQPLPCLDSIGRDHVQQHDGDAILSLPFADDIVSRLSLQRLHRLTRRLESMRAVDTEGSLDKAIRNKFCAFWYSLRFGILVPLGCLWKGRDRIYRVEESGLRAKAPRKRSTSAASSSASSHSSSSPRAALHGADAWNLDAGVAAPRQTTILKASDDGFGGEDVFVYPRLFLVGTLVHVQRHRLPDGTAAFVAKPSEPNDAPFRDIVLTKDMFVDHMPWRLSSALADVLGFHFARARPVRAPSPPEFSRNGVQYQQQSQVELSMV